MTTFISALDVLVIAGIALGGLSAVIGWIYFIVMMFRDDELWKDPEFCQYCGQKKKVER